MARERGVPQHRPAQRAGVGIEQQLGGIELVTVSGDVGPRDPIAVEPARPYPFDLGVPDAVAAPGEWSPLGLHGVRRLIEEAELDGGGVSGEEREGGTRPSPGGAEWR